HRTRHADFGNLAPEGRARWLGMPIAALSTLDRALVVGSFLRKDHPLFAQRIRQAARHGAAVHSLHALADDWAMPMGRRLIAAPLAWVETLAGVAAEIAAINGVPAPVPAVPSEDAKAIAASLLMGERKALMLGNAAMDHPNASALLALANWIGQQVGATVGYLGAAANSVGAQLVQAVPGAGGLSAQQMLTQPMKALLLLNTEPSLDTADAAATVAAMKQAGLVVALTPFADVAADMADVMLPIAPFTETAGTFVNAEGRVQSFHGVVKPLGETRPGWKVLRVLGNLLGIAGFEQESADEVRAEALGDLSAIAGRLNNAAGAPVAVPAVNTLQRVADVPIYATDSLVRRAPALQHTADAQAPRALLPQALWDKLGLQPGGRVLVQQGTVAQVLPADVDSTLAADVVRVAAGHPDTVGLGPMFGLISVEKA
ncbi:MAG: molybdopterin-dependent oxidoreductase, partial [Rhodoferax sp.]|nr:molybdopterin-dependent oxidoreductase [Rhodoferax sp.]